MSEQLELGILLAQSSSAGGSPAKISQRQAQVLGWRGAAPAFGGSFCGSFARVCPDSSLLKTSQTLLSGGLAPYSGNLPKAGMMRSGTLSALEPSGLATGVIEFSSSHGFGVLPTPTASTYGSSQNGTRADGSTFNQAGKPSLRTMAVRRGLGSTRGKLSAEFVRWMMGFPTGWLDSEP